MNNEGEGRGGDAATRPQYPIGTVARRTGLSAHLLRAWERRYGVVEPVRSEGGARLYSLADIRRLHLLRRAVDAGHAIGRVAALSSEALARLAGEEELAPRASADDAAAGPAEEYVAACLEAVQTLNGARIHAILSRAAVALGARAFSERVVVPLLRRVGELWETGAICPAHEHVVSVQAHRVLTSILATLPSPPGAPTVVVTTPAGHRHELAALLAGVEAAGEGWRVEYLGPDLPAADIATAVEMTGAEAVILSVVRESTAEALCGEVEALRARLGEEIAVLVGGRGANAHRDGVMAAGGTWLPDLPALAGVLSGLADGGVDGTGSMERR